MHPVCAEGSVRGLPPPRCGKLRYAAAHRTPRRIHRPARPRHRALRPPDPRPGSTRGRATPRHRRAKAGARPLPTLDLPHKRGARGSQAPNRAQAPGPANSSSPTRRRLPQEARTPRSHHRTPNTTRATSDELSNKARRKASVLFRLKPTGIPARPSRRPSRRSQGPPASTNKENNREPNPA